MPLQRGEVSAEVAAGLYFEERRALAAALHRLLQVHVLPGAELPPEVAEAIVHFNHGLLSARSNGRSILVSRLIDLITVHHPLEPCFRSRYDPCKARIAGQIEGAVSYC